MKASVRWLTWIAVATLAAGAAFASKDEAPAETPQQQARAHYDKGRGALDRASKLEARAEGAQTVEEREEILGKARKQFDKAAADFKKAVALDTGFYEAYSSLGYASRRLGDYEFAVQAYDTALELNPEYAEAIEYRGEAFLGLGEVDRAKDAYMKLFNLDRAKADELLAAMKDWIRDRRAAPDAPGGDKVDALAGWVKKRDEIASQGSDVSRNGGRGW